MFMVRFANVSELSGATTSISSHFDGAAATPTINHDGAAATPSIYLKNGDFEPRGVASSTCLHLDIRIYLHSYICICICIHLRICLHLRIRGHDGAVTTINLCGAVLTIHFQSPRVVSIWLRLTSATPNTIVISDDDGNNN